MSDSLRPHGLYSPWSSPGQNTGVGSLSLLQGIFPTQGSNPGLPHCRRILYQPSHKGRPKLGVKLLISFSKKLSLSWISSSWKTTTRTFSSVQFSRSVMSNSLWPNESQHAKPPCPSPTPGVHPNSCASSRWCYPAISSSVVPFSSCPQSLPASGSFPMSQLFTWGGQTIGVLASTSVLPMNTQDWSALGWTSWISLQRL